jgi:5-(carboxyamino)imidazole ribonucleotide mutase
MADVLILLGSTSDEQAMQACREYLTKFGITSEMKISSAHRQPEETSALVKAAEAGGTRVIIAGAGMAAHLPGFCASLTTLPVIGVPLAGSELSGVDALYSMVQMPAGIPVATVAIGKAGAKNAAVLAAEILALSNPSIRRKLSEFRNMGSTFPAAT